MAFFMATKRRMKNVSPVEEKVSEMVSGERNKQRKKEGAMDRTSTRR